MFTHRMERTAQGFGALGAVVRPVDGRWRAR
jgi:hypothetical protein